MKHPKLFAASAAALALCSISYAAAPDPIVMNVGGKNVPLSEFEYLYNKNNTQQENPVTLDEYVNMFVDYKMKVLAAESARLDTSKTFIDDIAKFSADLAEPYLTDSAVVDSLERLTYDRMHRNVDVSHIMITADREPSAERQRQLLDSLRTVVLSGGADFADLARAYSTDPSASKNGGRIGYITVGRFPYEIEERAFSMKPGEVSEPFTTRFGMHIIRVNDVRDDIGKVKVRHILKLFGNDTTAAAASADSIYKALLDGADFAKLAVQTTDDPTGRKTGGDLPWFGSGSMVPEFEAAAFGLKDGELSKPIATAYGFHVIRRDGYKAVGTLDEERPAIDKMFQRDYRSTLGRQRRMQQIAAEVGVTESAEALEMVKSLTAELMNTRSLQERLTNVNSPLATVGGKVITVAEIAAAVPQFVTPNQYVAAFRHSLDVRKNELLSEIAREKLLATNANYANLLNEYRDGILLYEISDSEVWGKANSDTEGLTRFFESHRADYTWDKPRLKGYVLMATSDSVAALAREFIDASFDVPSDSLGRRLRSKFTNNVRLERVLAPQGANPIIDYVAFGGPRPEAMSVWKSFSPVRARVIAQPEELADVKGQVSVDYQKQLEKEWLDRLHRTYKVKINNKVLNQLR